MKRADFLQRLREGTLLCDGAMGTQLLARGLQPGECSDRWCIVHAVRVQAIHRDYFNAGSDMVTTNTFGATRSMLGRHGLEAKVSEINIAGAQAARAGAGPDAIVLGDVGPFGDFLEPVGTVTEPELEAIFSEQIAALHEGGADGILIETMADPGEATVAVRVARRVADWPVLTTFAFSKIGDGSFRTMTGATVGQIAQTMRDAGVDALGANCGTSLSLPEYVELARQLVAAAGPVAVILQPNAGSPGAGDRRSATPEEMGQVVPMLLDAGVRILGGCCGTTPLHISAIARSITARKAQ